LTLAAASLKAGNYRAALAGAREVLALDPANTAAADIRRQAEAALGRFDADIADTRRRLSAGDLEGAARSLERARSVDATAPSVGELGARLAEAFRARETAARSASRATSPELKPPPPPQSPSQPVPAGPTGPPQTTLTPPVGPPPVETAPPVVLPTPGAPAVVPPPPPSPAPKPAPSATPERRVDPPPPPAPAVETDDSAIRQVIATYGRAIEGKDMRLFRSIKPNLTAEEERRLQEGFRAVTSQRVSLTIISIDRKNNRAVAIVRRRDEIEAGGRRQTTDTRQALTLARSDAGWVIIDIR
jgi:hypothetical protein